MVTREAPRGGAAPDAAAALDPQAVLDALRDVKDPEIPVVSVVELGMVRAVEVAGDRVRVDVTPTFAGCPAFHAIREAIRERALELGAREVEVRRLLDPAWSTDDMTEEARAQLRAFGIAPPQTHGGLLIPALEAPVPCPRCGSLDTELRNAFGSALCREIYTCASCGEAFERFKPL